MAVIELKMIFFEVVIVMIMLAASVKDIKYKQISVYIPALCAVVSVAAGIYGMFFEGVSFTELIASLIPGMLLIFLGFLSRGKIGYGDGIMLMCIGPAFGSEKIWLGIMTALMLSGLISIVLLTIKRAERNTEMAFIPFMTIGMGVMLFA